MRFKQSNPALCQTKQRSGLLLLFICLFNLYNCIENTAQAQAQTKAHTKNQTDSIESFALFLKAEHAVRTNDILSRNKLFPQLKNHPLYGYLEYQQLKKEINNNKNEQNIFYSKNITLSDILEYRNTYSDHPLGNTLLEFWLSHTAQQQDWDHFLEAWDSAQELKLNIKPSLSLACHQIYAQSNLSYQNKKVPTHLLETALSLWQQISEPLSACESLSQLLVDNKMLSPEVLFAKYQFLIEKKTKASQSLATKIYAKLPLEYKNSAQLYAKLIKQPQLLDDPSVFDKIDHFKSKIIASAFKNYAKINAPRATIAFENFEKHYENQPQKLHLNSVAKTDIIKQIALYLAYQHHKDAALWLNKIPAPSVDSKVIEWQIRVALKQHHWQSVLAHIEQFDAIQAKQPVWQYWKARALEALHLPGYASLYKGLAPQRHYYGFLASERLGQGINLNHKPHPKKPQFVKQLAQSDAIQRIHALLTLKRPVDANREWYHLVASLNTIEKTHAARLAHQFDWHHWAIYTFNQSEHKDDVFVRFPFAFKDIIAEHAQNYKIDEDWILALSRQESNFNAFALSPVGAMGLMQLMPGTAHSLNKSIKKTIDINDTKNPASLSNPYTNIELGTRYLKSLYRATGNPITTIAAYNAGLSRVKRWLPNTLCESDIWIDTIPYNETRNYVQNVLANTCIYKTLQNKNFLLSKMMPMIDPSMEAPLE